MRIADRHTSIITVTYNSDRCLQRLRESLHAHTRLQPYEWIVVDNGSTRGETHRLLDELERTGEALVIRHAENLWFTAGVNAGIAKAGCDRLLLLNPDCAVTPGWLEALLAPFEVPGLNVGIVGAVLVNERGQVVHGGGVGMGQHEGFGQPYDPQASWAQGRVHDGWVTGACLMVSREALDAAGGALPTEHLHYHSDRVLCDRVRAAGYRVWMSSHVLLHSLGGCAL